MVRLTDSVNRRGIVVQYHVDGVALLLFKNTKIVHKGEVLYAYYYRSHY